MALASITNTDGSLFRQGTYNLTVVKTEELRQFDPMAPIIVDNLDGDGVASIGAFANVGTGELRDLPGNPCIQLAGGNTSVLGDLSVTGTINGYQKQITYGSASSSITTIQTGGVASTPTTIPFDTVEITSGIPFDFVTNPTHIPVSETGDYKFSWSIQLDKVGGGVAVCDIWLRVNGVDVPRSGGQVVVNGTNGETLPFVEYILPLTAGQYIEVCFASVDPTMAVTSFPAKVTPADPFDAPAIPSIIANIYRLS